MLVMDEAFDMWVRGKTPYDYALDFPQWWREDLSAMVAKDQNHPSVIMYSIGNEIVELGTPHGAHLARQMAEHLRGLDQQRLITNGMNPMLTVIDELDDGVVLNEEMAASMGADPNLAMGRVSAGENVTRRTAEACSAMDVVGLNYAETRYGPDRELFPRRILVGSETFPKEIGRLWPTVVDLPNVVGDFTWTGWDYLGEVGIGSVPYRSDVGEATGLEREYPWLAAWCGDLDLTGWRRPISYYREIVFGLRAQPYLAVLRPQRRGAEVATTSPWSWSDSIASWTWPGFEGTEVDVEVYSDADTVALTLNGVEVARESVGESRPMLASLTITYQPGELEAIAYRDGEEQGRCQLRTAAGAVHLRATVDRSQLRADTVDLAFIDLELVDAAGTIWTSEDRQVLVEVTGAGCLAGLGSGNPATTERFDATSRTTFDGRLLAVIRPSEPGTVVVRASATGCAPTTVKIEVS